MNSRNISDLISISSLLKELLLSTEADFNIASEKYDEIADDLSSQKQHLYNLGKARKESVFSPRELQEIENDPCKKVIASLEDKITIAEKDYKDLRDKKERIYNSVILLDKIIDELSISEKSSSDLVVTESDDFVSSGFSDSGISVSESKSNVFISQGISETDSKSDFIITTSISKELLHLSHSCKEISEYALFDPSRASIEIKNIAAGIDSLLNSSEE